MTAFLASIVRSPKVLLVAGYMAGLAWAYHDHIMALVLSCGALSLTTAHIVCTIPEDQR